MTIDQKHWLGEILPSYSVLTAKDAWTAPEEELENGKEGDVWTHRHPHLRLQWQRRKCVNYSFKSCDCGDGGHLIKPANLNTDQVNKWILVSTNLRSEPSHPLPGEYFQLSHPWS